MIYLDSSAVIRLIEGSSDLPDLVLAEIDAEEVCTSSLAITECLTKPVRDGQVGLAAIFDEWFASSELRLILVSAQIARMAADCRAQFGLKTPDAVHVASALSQRAAIFLTSDTKLARCQSLNGLQFHFLRAT